MVLDPLVVQALNGSDTLVWIDTDHSLDDVFTLFTQEFWHLELSTSDLSEDLFLGVSIEWHSTSKKLVDADT